MTAKMTCLGLHQFDIIVNSPALKCWVSGQNVLCITGVIELPEGLPWSCSCQSWSLSCFGVLKVRNLSYNVSCSQVSQEMPSCANKIVLCDLKAFLLLSEFFSGTKYAKIMCDVFAQDALFTCMLVSDFQNSPCWFFTYSRNLTYIEFEGLTGFAWHPVFLRAYARLSPNQ